MSCPFVQYLYNVILPVSEVTVPFGLTTTLVIVVSALDTSLEYPLNVKEFDALDASRISPAASPTLAL